MNENKHTMRNVLLVLLAVSGALIISGVAIMAVTGFLVPESARTAHNAYYSEPKLVTQTASLSDCVAASLTLVNSNLQIMPYDGAELKLSYQELYANQWDYSLDAGKMRLVPHTDHRFWVFDGIRQLTALWNGEENDTVSDVTLYVPRGKILDYDIDDVNGTGAIGAVSAGKVKIKCVNSRYTTDGLNASGDCTFTNVNGSFDAQGLHAPSLRLQGFVNSSCSLTDAQAAKIDAEGFVNGRLNIKAAGSPQDYAVDYTLTNGSVKFDGKSYGRDGSIGYSGAPNHIRFQGVNSDLTVSFS